VLSLVNVRNIMSKSISNRRRSLSRTPAHTLSYTPSPGPRTVALMEEAMRENEQYFRDLIEMGGRPAFPSLEIFYAPMGTRGEYEDIIEYWSSKGGVRGQRNRWILFRIFQRRNRKTAEIFAQYQQDVCEYRRKEGIEGLLFDQEQQTKVDRWKEYHYFEHRKLAHMKAKAEESRQKRESDRKEWEAAHETGHNIDPNVPSDVSWIYRYRDESELGHFMVFLNWIERQLPEIARECEIPDREASKDIVPTSLDPVEVASRPEETTPKVSNVLRTIQPNGSSTNRNKKSKNLGPGPVQPSNMKSNKSSMAAAIRHRQHNVHNSQLSSVRDADLQEQQPTPTVAPRRSQRIAMLQQKKQKKPPTKSTSGVVSYRTVIYITVRVMLKVD
jgi:hypothetical protein